MSDKNVTVNLQIAGVAEVGRAFKSVEKAVTDAEKGATRVTQAESKKRLKIQSESINAIMTKMKSLKGEDVALAWNRNWKNAMDSSVRNTLSAIDKMKNAMRSMDSYVGRQMASGGRNSINQAFGMASGFMGSARRTASFGANAVALGGGYMIADQARKYMSEEGAAIMLSRSMTTADSLRERGGRGFDPKSMMAFAGQVRGHTGMDKAEFLQAAQSYVAKSSDWKMLDTEQGQKDMMELAKISVGTGTAMGDVMNAAGMLKVQNPKLDSQGMLSLMRNIVGQGKMGAVEISDLAQHAAKITSTSGSYSQGAAGYGSQDKAQGALLGMAQIAIQTAGSAAEAATVVQNMSGELEGKVGQRLKKNYNIDVFERNKEGKSIGLRKNSDIMADIFTATQGDSAEFTTGGKVGFGQRSVRYPRALNPYFQNTYREKLEELKGSNLSEDEKKKQAVAAGALAVKNQISRFETAGYDQKSLDADFKAVMDGTGKRLEMAFSSIQDSVMKGIVPSLEQFSAYLKSGTGEIGHFAAVLGQFAKTVTDHPILSAFSLIAVKAGGVTGALGGLGVALLALHAWVTEWVDSQKSKHDKIIHLPGQAEDTVKAFNKKLENGATPTKDDMAAFQSAKTEIESKFTAAKKHAWREPTFMDEAASFMTTAIGDDAGREAMTDNKVQEKLSIAKVAGFLELMAISAEKGAKRMAAAEEAAAGKGTPNAEPGPKSTAREKPLAASGRN